MNLFTWEGLKEESILFLDGEGKKTTGKDLMEYCQNRCGRLEKSKLLFLLCKNHVECIKIYLSALRKGVVVLLLDDGIKNDLLVYLEETYQPDYIVCTSRENRLMEGYSKWQQSENYEFYQRNDTIEHPMYKDLALLLTTSGSTGSPKLVRLSKENIMSNAKSIAEYLKIDGMQRPVTVLPMHYTFGLSIIHSHLYKDATILVTDKTLMEREFWTYIKEYKATSLSGVPYTFEILKRVGYMEQKGLSIQTLTQAGGKLSEKLQEEYAQFARKNGISFYVMYGQTEATARMGYLPPEYSCEKIGSMGIAIPGGRFEIEDGEGNIITKPNISGELIYYGKNVSLGYAEKAEDLEKEDQWKGCLRTGDIACFDDEGFYYIKGRNKRFIKMYGNRISLDEIERLLKSQYEIDCAATGVDLKLSVWYVPKEEISEDDMTSYLWEITGIPRRNIEFKLIKSIPRNTSGKTIYKELE